MRYPPALALTPRSSVAYGVFASLFAIILIALCACFYWANGSFDIKISLLIALSLGATAWLLRDAWRKPRGQLHYREGQWTWQLGEAEIPGTLRLHLDLQTYMLVSFSPSRPSASFFNTTTQWFHLEERQLGISSGAAPWLALRRAVIAASPLTPIEQLA